MEQMTLALNVYNAFRARAQAKNAVKFAEACPETVEYCAAIERWLDG